MLEGKKAIDHMRSMATGCRWRVIRKIPYVKSDGSTFVLKPGIWYTGVPYTQGKKKRLYDLLRFRSRLLFGQLYSRKFLLGSDCSSAASFAWQEIRGDMPVMNTRKMLADLCGPRRFFSHGGRYDVRESDESTGTIVSRNSPEVMSAAYDELRIGDGLLQYDKAERKGHIMLITDNPPERLVRIIDQKGFGEGSSEREDTSWRIDHEFSYDELMEEGYVPLFLLHEV